MAGVGDVCDGGDALNRLQKVNISSRDQALGSLFTSAPSSNSFLGPRTMLSFGGSGGANRLGSSLYQCFEQEECGDDFLDEYLNQPEKKRRLSIDKVQFLEKSFEADNKLEPERKIQLAKELGLQPRQIAIWFQNRRARWKTRQLETDYETLNANYKGLKTDYDNLVKENEKLKAEVLYLKHNGLARDTEKASSQSCDAAELPKEAIVGVISEDEESKTSSANQEQSSERTDLANVGPSRVLEPDWSDLSHNGEDELNEELLQQPDYVFPKMEGSHCHTPTSSFYYGLPGEDHAFSFWSY